MSDERQCPRCSALVPAGRLEGLCPACLLKQGSNIDTASQRESTPFEPPSVEEMRQLFPQLEIVELIGKGGMGAVYKARQPALDRLVALKILPPQPENERGFSDRFNREARALARLNHPNIVSVHEFGKASGYHFLLLEYVDGANLRQLENQHRLAPREALQVVMQICDALQYAHDQGVVHRDIKPENVLMDRKGRVKIADFGLAKILGREPVLSRLTDEGDIMGTPHYMAPEQLEHPREVDHRADIYSLGVVFYELLTGELPMGKFPPPSRQVGVDVRLDEVVLRSLEKEPARRYQHVVEVKTDVQNIAESPEPTPATPVETKVISSPQLAAARREVKWPAMGLLVAGILNWIAIPLLLVLLVPRLAEAAIPKPLLVTLLCSPFVLCTLLMIAALKIMRLQAHTFGMAAAVLAMVITPGNLLGFPMGLWALFVLTRPEVRAAFKLNRASNPTPAKREQWKWMAAGAALVVLLAGVTVVSLLNWHAQPNMVVAGQVIDPTTGLPISRAHIADNGYGPRGRAPNETWSGENGSFALTTWAEEHNVVVAAPGYSPRLILVDGSQGKVLRRDVSLTPMAPGEAAEVPGSVDSMPPVVVATVPVSGASEVPPGEMEIRVRFSKEMNDGNWSWSTAWENSSPAILAGPSYSPDRRTCTIKARLEPGRTYGFWLNSDTFQNFKDLRGNPSVPYLLIFRTAQAKTP